ncbi:MAG: hypothetical protein V1926_00275 [Candidatus Peregrinibacteria bacterium]
MAELTQTQPANRGQKSLLQVIAVPMFLFGCTLALFLLLSLWLLLPRFTSVQADGRQLSQSELATFVHDLQAKITAAETKRDALVTPGREGVHAALVRRKTGTVTALRARAEIEAVAARMVLQTPDAVHLSSLHFFPLTRCVELAGSVHSVGPRSMTVLAQFVETLRSLPWVSSVTLPRFAREEDPEHGTFSPFVFQLTVL